MVPFLYRAVVPYYDYRIQWTADPHNYYSMNPDMAVVQPS